MYQLERLKCKTCNKKISWVSQNPDRNYPPALYMGYCRTCYDKQLEEPGKAITPDTASQSNGFKSVIDTTDPQWRRDNFEPNYY